MGLRFDYNSIDSQFESGGPFDIPAFGPSRTSRINVDLDGQGFLTDGALASNVYPILGDPAGEFTEVEYVDPLDASFFGMFAWGSSPDGLHGFDCVVPASEFEVIDGVIVFNIFQPIEIDPAARAALSMMFGDGETIEEVRVFALNRMDVDLPDLPQMHYDTGTSIKIPAEFLDLGPIGDWYGGGTGGAGGSGRTGGSGGSAFELCGAGSSGCECDPFVADSCPGDEQCSVWFRDSIDGPQVIALDGSDGRLATECFGPDRVQREARGEPCGLVGDGRGFFTSTCNQSDVCADTNVCVPICNAANAASICTGQNDTCDFQFGEIDYGACL